MLRRLKFVFQFEIWSVPKQISVAIFVLYLVYIKAKFCVVMCIIFYSVSINQYYLNFYDLRA